MSFGGGVKREAEPGYCCVSRQATELFTSCRRSLDLYILTGEKGDGGTGRMGGEWGGLWGQCQMKAFCFFICSSVCFCVCVSVYVCGSFYASPSLG